MGASIRIVNSRFEHTAQLEELEKLIFPTMDAQDLLQQKDYQRLIQIFPEGQLVALDGDKVVGMSNSIRVNFDFDRPNHTNLDIIAGGFASHTPTGDWIYMVDTGVHPEYRRMGIAKSLYQVRQMRAKELGARGQIGGAMMSGFGALKHLMNAETYFQKLKQGEIIDPTISMQMSVGFEPRALIPNYVIDPVSDNYGVLIVWPVEAPSCAT